MTSIVVIMDQKVTREKIMKDMIHSRNGLVSAG